MAGGGLVRQGETPLAKERRPEIQTTQEWDFHGPSCLCQLPLNSSQCWLDVLGYRCGSCRHGSLPAMRHFRYWLLFTLTHHFRDLHILCKEGGQQCRGNGAAVTTFPSPLADVQLLLLHRKRFPSSLQERRNVPTYFKVSAKENSV